MNRGAASQPDPARRRILVVEPDAVLRNVLCNFLARDHHVDVVATADEARTLLLSAPPYHLAMAELHLQPGTGIDFLAEARRRSPATRAALITATRIDDYFARLHPAGILNVFVRATPFNYDDFAVAVDNLLFPRRCMGLARYLAQPCEIRTGRVRSHDSRRQVVDDAMAFFRRFRSYDTDINGLRLALEEVINNSIYHSFRLGDGTEKYRVGEFSHLDPSEDVTVEYGRDTRHLGFSVTDNQGTMDPAMVMKRIERQISMEGLYDMNGRGIFLTRNLSDRMVINIHPRVATQVVLVFRHRTNAQPRPLHINVIDDRTN